MDYQALKDYIEADATFANDIAIGSDAGIADKINARSVSAVGGVTRSRFSMWCGATGLRGAIEDIAANPAHPLRSVALTVKDFLLGGVSDSLDLSDPVNQMMLGAWVQAGALTQVQADELIAMATVSQPVFGQNISHQDVAKALRG
jgi:hypothetical protein